MHVLPTPTPLYDSSWLGSWGAQAWGQQPNVTKRVSRWGKHIGLVGFDSSGPKVVFTGAWFDTFDACSQQAGTGIAIAFFVATLVVGFYLVMNLFIAILLSSFGEEEEEPATRPMLLLPPRSPHCAAGWR